MKPGIYTDFDFAAYRRDPCDTASLTQSLAKIMLDRSPLHAWMASPKLNPNYQHDDDRKYDVGNIAHSLMIGRGKDIVVIEGFDDWRKKEAKERREEVGATGKLGVLEKHYNLAQAMVKSARKQLDSRGLQSFFKIGDGEVVTAWQEDGIWLRQAIDWLAPDRRVFLDYKTTDESAAPHALGRKMLNDGWIVQAAMAERGLDVLDPPSQGRRRYFFIVQETEEPYCLSVAEIGEAPLTIGRKMLDAAVTEWRKCMKANIWPGYPSEILAPQLPAWAEQQWLDREVAAAEKQDNVLMAG